MHSNNKGLNRLGNILLIIIFTLMIIISGFGMLGALTNFQHTNENIRQTIGEVKKDMKKLIDKKKLAPSETVLVERLETAGRGILDANLMSFLFQFYSIVLVSAGVYLLTRSKANINFTEKLAQKTAKKIDKISDIVADRAISSAIEINLAVANQFTWLLRVAKDETTKVNCVSSARNALTKCKNELEQLRDKQLGLEKERHEVCMDQTANIKINLDSLPSKCMKRVASLKEISDKCYNILKDTDFVEIFEKQLSELKEIANKE